MGSKKKNMMNALFLAAVFLLTIWAVFRGKDIHMVIRYLETAEKPYILAGIVCVITFIWGESIIIWYLLGTIGYQLKPLRCYLYSFIGFFFSCITPSATGGQPAQIFYMKKDNIPVPESTLVLMIVTITYKFVLVVLGLLILLIRPARVMFYLEPVMFWMYLGIALNVFCVISMLTLVFHPHLARVIMVKGLSFLERLHLLKTKPERMQKLENAMNQYHGAAEYYWSHKLVVVNAFFITVLQRLVLFFVTYLIYRAFRIHGESAWVIVSLQGMISVAVDMLPLPGGMGISETLFLIIFQPIFGEMLILPAMILSRGISYYSQLLISAVMTVAAHFIIRGESEKET